MVPQDNNSSIGTVTKPILSVEARLFAEKAARSIAEIQRDIVNVSDVVTFLEVLGYDDKEATNHGFSDLLELANYIVSFIDKYKENIGNAKAHESLQIGIHIAVPSFKSRLVEALAAQAPWLGALVVLNLTGVSLWMAHGLPNAIATLFVAGVYAGLIISEGLLNVFSRLLFMYYDQRNLSEVKRVILRGYISIGVVLVGIAIASAALFAVVSIPASYTLLFIGTTASMALHRMSFNLLYTLKMVKNITVAYATGFMLLLLCYYYFFLLPPGPATGASAAVDVGRYFASLGIAFAAISAFAVHAHIVALRRISRRLAASNTGVAVPSSASSQHLEKEDQPRGTAISFYKPQTSVKNSLKSRFDVQFLESLPQFVSGLFFFLMLFGDRILSWIFNPNRLVIGGGPVGAGYQIPFAFNSQYHIGADIALLVLVPVAIMQYLLVSPLYSRVHNLATNTRLRDINKIGSVISALYGNSLLFILAVVGVSVVSLNLFGPDLIPILQGTNSSLTVLRLTSLGNLGLAVLTTNLIFLNYLNIAKRAAAFVVLAAVLTITLGAIFAQFGVAAIAYGYLISSITVGSLSTLFTRRAIRTEFVRAISRFS